ncbi:hypothetical protein [Leeia aquatica]|uniref:Uncharacterized protein n=1 Tax=Leeia aquatica TaxID=2725557 RepID=A0A847RUW8_9NEIS|nr:hypothetical protein [Leeia aquatica]NLR73631.1 hypothetical protein [Leeia aquatica]
MSLLLRLTLFSCLWLLSTAHAAPPPQTVHDNPLEGLEDGDTETAPRFKRLQLRERPLQVKLSADGKVLRLSGSISTGAADKVANVLANAPQLRVVRLQSPGGLLGEAIRINQLLKARQVDIWVPSSCASACTIIFAAGKERYMAPKAEFGFHHHLNSSGKTDAEDDQQVREQLKAAGIPDVLLDGQFATPFDAMWLPTVRQLTRSDYVTDVVSRPPAGLASLPVLEPDEVNDLLEQDDEIRLLRKALPQLYETHLPLIQKAAAENDTLVPVWRAIQEFIYQGTQRILPYASDEAILARAARTKVVARAQMSLLEGYCPIFGVPAPNKQYSGDDTEDVRWLVNTLQHLRPEPVLTGLRAQILLEQTNEAAEAAGKVNLRLLKAGRRTEPGADNRPYCQALLDLYDWYDTLPLAQRVTVTRALLLD